VKLNPVKTQNQFVISDKQRTHFGQKHAFGGFHSCLLGVFREMEFTDHGMKHGEPLGGIRFFGTGDEYVGGDPSTMSVTVHVLAKSPRGF
jgi:hypothetical protein